MACVSCLARVLQCLALCPVMLCMSTVIFYSTMSFSEYVVKAYSEEINANWESVKCIPS